MKKNGWYKLFAIALCLTVILSAAVIVLQQESRGSQGPEYTVTFITWSQGDNPDTPIKQKEFASPFDEQFILKGERCDDPGTPKNIPAGYVFMGWYAVGKTVPFDFSSPVNSDLELYAWFDKSWGTPVQVDSLASLKAAVAAALDDTPVSIELTANITFTAAADLITIPAKKIIQFTSADEPGAPFSINAAGFSRAIKVDAEGTLYLKDLTITGGIVTGTEAGGGVQNLGTLVLNSGTLITGNKSGVYGGGVYSAGTFVMNAGAEISGNTTQNGGGVANRYSGSTFTMNGGIISSNTAQSGGGVYNLAGTFIMNSGEISGHTVTSHAGGVYNTGIFEMYQSGETDSTLITGNTAQRGGGLSNNGSSAKFTLHGGTISNNEATYAGGGLFNDGSGEFFMSGGLITGNKAIQGGTSSGMGGGACIWSGKVSMSGGEIFRNEARFGGGVFNYTSSTFNMTNNALIANNSGMLLAYSSGGGVYNFGLFTMYDDAALIGNIAPYGGAVFVEMNKFTMESGSIWGNSSTTGNGGAIYLNNVVDPNAEVIINGGTISENSTVANGGGIWVARAFLDKVTIASGVVFSDNSAATARDRDPADDAVYNAQIGINGEGVTWTAPFTQGYNNYDIGYFYGTILVIVTFMQNNSDLDETVIVKILVEKDTAIGTQMPADPSRVGYAFTGWNTSRIGSGTAYSGSDPVVTANTVLYAQWVLSLPPPPPPTKYTVTYKGNGNTSGTPPVDSNKYLSGELVFILGKGDLERTGYTFFGWASYPSATSATYIPGSSFHINYNLTLYAVWHSDELHTVTFINWDNSVISAQGVPHGGSAVEPAHPSRTGFVFLGWDKPFDNVTTDLTVRALFEAITAEPDAPGEWGLLNLILAFLGIGVALAFVAIAMRRERASGSNLDEKHGFAWLCVSVVAAIAGIVFFFMTEDTSLPMIIVDNWTVVNVLIFIIVVMAAVLTLRGGGSYMVYLQDSPKITNTVKGSPYSFAMENGYDGAVSYRVGEDGQWKQVFPDESGRYTIPEEEISGDIYLEYHP